MTTKQITDLPSATTANDNDLLLKRDDGANADQALSIQTLVSEAFGDAATENAAVTATPDTLAKRDALGRVQSQSGGSGATAVVHNDTSINADADTVARRDALGRLKVDGGGSGQDAVNHNDLASFSSIPSGSRMLFYQASAPSGWSQITSVNDRVIRVVSTSGGGTGGSWTISGLSVLDHVLTVNEMPGHSHTMGSGGVIAIVGLLVQTASTPMMWWVGLPAAAIRVRLQTVTLLELLCKLEPLAPTPTA